VTAASGALIGRSIIRITAHSATPGTMFVKDDTHMRACCMDLLGKERSARSRVEYVIRSAN